MKSFFIYSPFNYLINFNYVSLYIIKINHLNKNLILIIIVLYSLLTIFNFYSLIYFYFYSNIII